MDKIIKGIPIFIYTMVYIFSLFSSYKQKNNSRKSYFITALVIIFIYFLNIILYLITENDNFYGTIFTAFLPSAIYITATGKRSLLSSLTAMFNSYMTVFALYLMHDTITIYLKSYWHQYLAMIFIPFVLLYLKNIYIPLHDTIEKLLPKLLYAFLGFGIIVLLESYLYKIIMEDTSRLILRYNILAAGTLVVYFLAILFFRIIIKYYSEQIIKIKDNEIIEQQINDLENLLRSRESNEQKLKIIRHDLRHIMSNISNLINIGKYDEALEYTELYFNKIENTTNITYCKDFVINTVLDQYTSICEQNDIRFDIIVNDFEKDLKISNYEIATFISNCLENAVNACNKLKENKYITFKFLNNDGRLALQIKNSFNGIIKLNEANHPITNKKNHGIGTRSILGFAERNNLFVDYEIEDKTFTINVLFPEK